MRVILQVAIPSDSGQVSTFIEVYESDFDYERVAIPSDSGQVSTHCGLSATEQYKRYTILSQSLLIQGRFQQEWLKWFYTR